MHIRQAILICQILNLHRKHSGTCNLKSSPCDVDQKYASHCRYRHCYPIKLSLLEHTQNEIENRSRKDHIDSYNHLQQTEMQMISTVSKHIHDSPKNIGIIAYCPRIGRLPISGI